MTLCLRCVLLATLLGCGPSSSIDPSSDTGPRTDTMPWDGGGSVLMESGGYLAEEGEASGDEAPELATNGVRGGGMGAGSLDVYSLDYSDDCCLVLSWGGARVANVPGVDFVVFENAFEVRPGNHFMDLVIVEVSPDGESWIAMPHDYVAEDETVYSTDPADWPGFAGRTPVRFHAEDNPVDPFDQALAGGDGFDLDDLPASPVADQIRAEGALKVRLVTAPSRTNPDTGAPYVRDVISDGADIDGIIARALTGGDA